MGQKIDKEVNKIGYFELKQDIDKLNELKNKITKDIQNEIDRKQMKLLVEFNILYTYNQLIPNFGFSEDIYKILEKKHG